MTLAFRSDKILISDETVRPEARKQWEFSGESPKVYETSGGSTMSCPTKFELNPVDSLSANAQQLFQQSEARKWQ